jgi:hypothetical protein
MLLHDYFPHGKKTVLKTALGNDHAKYTYYDNLGGYQGLYDGYLNQGKPGIHSIWVKEYKTSGHWCTATNAVMFKGNDGSLTEAGDWTVTTIPCQADSVFGYEKNGSPTGLVWCPAGGLVKGVETTNEMNIVSQAQSGGAFAHYGYQAYSKSGLIEHYDTFTTDCIQPNMRGMWSQPGTYDDVVKVVMYHGTKQGNSPAIRCENVEIDTCGPYYRSFKNYNTYCIVLWLAKGVGVIQEQLLYTEDGSYWGMPNCSGFPMKKSYLWSSAIQL